MTWSFTIGKLFGSEIKVHATFVLLLAWIGSAAWLSEGPGAALLNVLFIIALFACVVAHEFGHALMARRFGIGTADITLLPIGGMARLEKIPDDPGQEIAVALAGPAVNVGIWAALTLFLGFGSGVMPLAQIEDTAQGFFERLAAVNLFLVLFNLIPAFPMDGGRVLRAVLQFWFGRARATQIAATGGQLIAFAFGYLGLTPDASMDLAESALLRSTQTDFPVLDPDGRLMGFLSKAAIVANANAQNRVRNVGAAMVQSIPDVKLYDPLELALDKLQISENPVVAVTDRSGHFVGYITRQNIGEWMVLNQGRRD